MSALKWKQKRHSMESSLHSIIVEEVRDEDYDNNNTIWLNKSEDVKKPELPTCQIKESTSTEGRNKLPKLVIRLGKRSLTQDKDDNNAGTLSQRRFSTTEANM
jgi:hypothetical protein